MSPIRTLSTPLPIDEVVPELKSALRESCNGILSAPPGAGKTTRVPLVLLGEPWLHGKKIIMLEPRRLAARRAAEYMAAQVDGEVGALVGYRMRSETKVGEGTRIEVVTEGILTRFLQEDPALPGVGLVLFDEFHERSVHADLGLALVLDVQQHLRPDLRLLVMSATLDGVAVSKVLGDVPVIEGTGRSFPVTTHYRRFAPDGPIEPHVVDLVVQAVRAEPGDILVFLPGRREIRRTDEMLYQKLHSDEIAVHSLYGDAPYEQQQAALSPDPRGRRKIILATSVAETSLTIDGVRVVVDSGLARSARFDPRRGMSGLVTGPVSRAVADQRRGRAGRQEPGVCYRLWTEGQHAQLPAFPVPEILVTDLAPLSLTLAQWGSPEGAGLRFIDTPPPPHLAQARALLQELGALDQEGKPTDHGRAMNNLPVHPRLAHMLLKGKELGLGAQACDVSALLEERDLLAGRSENDIDLASRWHALQQGTGVDRGTRARVVAQAQRLRTLLGVKGTEGTERTLGLLLALAYPERVARKRETGTGRYQMAGGTGAVLPGHSLLTREEFLAIGEVDGVGTEVRVFLAAALRQGDLERVFADHVLTETEVGWDPHEEAVVAREVERLGSIIVGERLIEPDENTVRTGMIEGVRQLGLAALPWDRDAESLRARSEWLRLRNLVPKEWPDLSNDALLRSIPEWLGAFLKGMRRRDHLARVDVARALRSLFRPDQWTQLEQWAPPHLKVPGGSRVRINYTAGTEPVLAVRIQEMFGESDTPRIAGGRVGLLLHLLSPAGRPLAVTQDLRSFWTTVYPGLRAQMRARYPKHDWPEEPGRAKPTRKTLRRGGIEKQGNKKGGQRSVETREKRLKQ